MQRSTISSSSIARAADAVLAAGTRSTIASTAGSGSASRLPVVVAIPARAGLLPEPPLLAEPVGDARPRHLRPLDVAPLADAPADVEAGEVAHPERSHRHAEALERGVDLRGRRAFLDEEHRLAQVVLDHAVADEAVAHARDDRDLADPLRELHRGREHVGGRARAAHDLEQLHHVRGTEEVQPDDVRRPRRRVGDPVDVERRRVGREDRARLRDAVELARTLAA